MRHLSRREKNVGGEAAWNTEDYYDNYFDEDGHIDNDGDLNIILSYGVMNIGGEAAWNTDDHHHNN